MLDDAIQYAHDRGMVTIVAAGNSNGDALDFSPLLQTGRSRLQPQTIMI